jgi:stalled ribosome rescue protein Dom34
MEKHTRYSAGAETNSAEDQRDRRFAGHLHKYYEKVASCIGDADSILILGPGEAKGELRACLQEGAFGGRVVALETADKMTDRQIAAKVRDHFSE